MTVGLRWGDPLPGEGVVTQPFALDRRPATVPAVAWYAATMVGDGVEAVTDRVVDEWLDVLRALRDHRFLTYDSVGYLGFSMGSRFGVPLAARLGDRLDAAVLGKYGVRHSGLLHPGLNSPQHTLNAARRVSAPVLFHLERHDEVFLRDDQIALFDALASRDKALVVHEGTHGTSRPADETMWLDFFARHLIRGATPASAAPKAAC